MCKNPKKSINYLLDYIGLKNDSSLKYFLDNQPPSNMNNKWSDNFSSDDLFNLSKIISKDEYSKYLD